MKIVLLCWTCGKEYSDVPLNQRPYLCECGGYVVSPSGKVLGKWVEDAKGANTSVPEQESGVGVA